VTLEQAEYEEMTFSGGEALDLTALDEAMLNKLAGEVKNQATKLGMSLVLKQGVLSSVMTLIGE
ncbi:MAG: hypothetical protein Q4A66_13525, partial [Eubacteriales bacterium]|nr:hypothetical protein [Eubacteriales bacterium]